MPPSRSVTRSAARRSRRAGTAPPAPGWPTTRRRPSCASPDREAGARPHPTAPNRTGHHRTDPIGPRLPGPSGRCPNAPAPVSLAVDGSPQNGWIEEPAAAPAESCEVRAMSHRLHAVIALPRLTLIGAAFACLVAVAVPAEAAQPHQPSIKETSRFLWGLAGEESGWNYFARN